MLSARIFEIEEHCQDRTFGKVLKLSQAHIVNLTELTVTVTISVPGKGRRTGRSSMYLSTMWAYFTADDQPSPEIKKEQMINYARKVSNRLKHEFGLELINHPLCLSAWIYEFVQQQEAGDPPLLARMVSASAVEAAYYDAIGQAFGLALPDMFNAKYETEVPVFDRYFPNDDFAIRAVSKIFRRTQATKLAAWLIVDKDDTREYVHEWSKGRHYNHFKLKISGTDPEADADFTIRLYRWVCEMGVAYPTICVDSNCKSRNVEAVLEYLRALNCRRYGAETYRHLSYLEQMTAHDIHRHPFDWRHHEIDRLLVLDEGVTSMEACREAKRQGWTGLALKTCKGLGFNLVFAAWAMQNNLQLTFQDLTNPDYAAVGSITLASWIKGIDSIEANAAQFTPQVYDDMAALQPMVMPIDGYHRIPKVPYNIMGLGSHLIDYDQQHLKF